MLTLRLKSGDYLTIGRDITVQVFQKKNNCLEVAVQAPRELTVLRGEKFEQGNERPAFLREHRAKTPSEKAANERRKETLARRADAARQLNAFLDKLESADPGFSDDIPTMREQISRLNGELKT